MQIRFDISLKSIKRERLHKLSAQFHCVDFSFRFHSNAKFNRCTFQFQNLNLKANFLLLYTSFNVNSFIPGVSI